MTDIMGNEDCSRIKAIIIITSLPFTFAVELLCSPLWDTFHQRKYLIKKRVLILGVSIVFCGHRSWHVV